MIDAVRGESKEIQTPSDKSTLSLSGARQKPDYVDASSSLEVVESHLETMSPSASKSKPLTRTRILLIALAVFLCLFFVAFSKLL